MCGGDRERVQEVLSAPVTKSGDQTGIEPAGIAGANVTLVAARGGQSESTPVHSPVPPSGRSSSVPRRAVLQGDAQCSFRPIGSCCLEPSLLFQAAPPSVGGSAAAFGRCGCEKGPTSWEGDVPGRRQLMLAVWAFMRVLATRASMKLTTRFRSSSASSATTASRSPRASSAECRGRRGTPSMSR